MMGGTIGVQSVYGKGSVFRVSLPQGIVDEQGIGKEVAEELRNFRFVRDRSRDRGNRFVRSYMPYGKTLVVDDLQTNLDVMKGLLMPYGLRVDMVLSGQEAVERVRAERVRYDLVFMDHMMPGMDGIEATRIIRTEIDSDYARTVPIIALTANALEGNRKMFLDSGFNDFISKPVDIKQLDMALNRWIRDKQSEAVLQDAESLNVEQAQMEPGEAAFDREGKWLLERPLEGIDFGAALERYGNSGKAYMSILQSFVAHTPALLEKMDAHLESSAGDYAIEVHGLKGTCGALGAEGTAALARELETAAREGNFGPVRQQHGRLRKETLELTERLKALLEEWGAGQQGAEKQGRAKPERELLVLLSSAAAEFNANLVAEILGDLEQYRYEEGQELTEWLREQAENYDYEAIHSRLEEFLNSNA
jgi:CheY-like chemotaxis protein